MSHLIQVLGKDNEIIPYRKELNSITGSITATILLQQIIYWYTKNDNKPFYKFIEPCKHEKYTEGDSWCEELGFSRKEFNTAIKKLVEKGLVEKKTNMSRLTYYFLNVGDLDNALKGIYINAERGFTKMPKGDLDNKDTETTTDIKEKNIKKETSALVDQYKEKYETTDSLIKILEDFIAYRKSLKKPIKTIQGLRGFAKNLKDIQSKGLSISAAIETMKENEWHTVKSSYLENTQRPQTNGGYKTKSQKRKEVFEQYRRQKENKSEDIEDVEVLNG